MTEVGPEAALQGRQLGKTVGGRIKALGSQALIYGVGTTLTRMIGFFLIPMYTRFLTPVDYGHLELLSVAATILTIIGAQGMTTAFFRFYPQASETNNIRAVVGTSHLYLTASGLLMGLAMIALQVPFGRLMFPNSEHGPVFIRLLAISVLLDMMVLVPFQVFRARLQAFRTVKISLAGFVVQLGLTIYLVAVARMGVAGILWGQVAGAITQVIPAIYLIRNDLELKVSPVWLKPLLALGLPLVLAGLARWVLEVSDRILIDRLATTHDLGLYSLGSKFGSILTVAIIGPFGVAWGAYCFQIAALPDAQKTFSRITTYYLVLLCGVGMGLAVWVGPVIRVAADPSFWEARHVVLPLVCTNILTGMVLLLSFGSIWKKKTVYLSYIMAGGAVANVLLNLVLIPPFGMYGSAVASVISMAAILAATVMLSQQLYPLDFETARLVKVGVVFTVVALAGTFLEFPNLIWDLSYRVALVLGFVGLLAVLKFFHPDEIRYLREQLSRARLGT